MKKLPTVDIEPIDFQALWKEERRKARQERRQGKVKQEQQQEEGEHPHQASSDDQPQQQHGESPVTASSFRNDANNVIDSLLPSWDYTGPVSFGNEEGASLECICSNPSSISYQENFLPPDYQDALVKWLLQLPENKNDPAHNNKNNISNAKEEPALHCWNRLYHAKRRVAVFEDRGGGSHSSSSFPNALLPLIRALCDTGIFPEDAPPNHILVNDYQPEQGIMPHTDGPTYKPVTATISMGGDVLLKFQARRRRANNETDTIIADTTTTTANLDCCCDDGPQVVLSGKGSLVVFAHEAYGNYLHSIADGVLTEVANETCQNAPPGTLVERHYRISLTVRHKMTIEI